VPSSRRPSASPTPPAAWRRISGPRGSTWTFLFSGYTIDDHGYLPTTEAYPDGSYEVDTSPFRPGSDERLVEASLALLSDLHT
jgi:hypothetical protein